VISIIQVLFGEAKWTREPLTESVLDTLIDRSNLSAVLALKPTVS
jgi:hypothetical protein